LTVRNVGTAAAAGSQLSLGVPSLARLVSASVVGGGSCTGTAPVACSLPGIGVGAAVDVQIVVTGTAAGSGAITASSADGAASATLTVLRAPAVVAAPVLAAVKAGPREPVVGKPFVLTATFVRRDNGSALAAVAARSRATLGRKSLACKTSSTHGKVTVSCRIAARSAGQRLRITVIATTAGGTSTRTFAFTVRRA
jgi:hypothetical protein